MCVCEVCFMCMCVCDVLLLDESKRNPNCKPMLLVHMLATSFGSAATRNLVVFDVELVVISQLFAGHNSSQSKDDDVLLAKNINDLRVAVWLMMKIKLISSC